MACRRRRFLRYGLRASAVGLVVVPIFVWFAFQRIPPWFQPVRVVDDALLQRARRDITFHADAIGDHLARREAAELTFDAATINEWITAAPHLYPDFGEQVGPEIRAAAIGLEPGRLFFGLHSASRGLECVWNLDVSISVSEDSREIAVTVGRIRGGALTLPRKAVFAAVMDRLGFSVDEPGGAVRDRDGAMIDDVRFDPETGVFHVANRFVWPNGRRAFRIERVSITTGAVALRLAPL